MDTAGQVVDGADFHRGWAARIVVSELSRCSRSDSDRALMAWVMTAWMVGS
jgi:hypothetical protein